MTYVIYAHRSAASVMGAAVALVKKDGIVETFESLEDARKQATTYNGNCLSPNVRYVAGEL